MKYYITKSKQEALDLQAIETKANGLPQTGARWDEKLQRIVNDPTTGFVALVISDIIEMDNGDFAYDVSADYDDALNLKAQEKTIWINAKNKSIDKKYSEIKQKNE